MNSSPSGLYRSFLFFGLVFVSCADNERHAARIPGPVPVQQEITASAPEKETTPNVSRPEGAVPPPPPAIKFIPPSVDDEDAPPPLQEAAFDPADKSGDYDITYLPPPPDAVRVQEGPLEYVEEIAEYPGGVTALKKYLADNLRYPEVAKEAGIQGKCYLKFVVSRIGEISDVKLLRGIPDCKECDQEAIRLIKAMPEWKPARQNGKAVDSYFTLPVAFKLY